MKYWKCVAKLATDFMSVRISMLSVFKLNELLSVSEISFILNPSSYLCIFCYSWGILSLLIQNKQISPENIFTKKCTHLKSYERQIDFWTFKACELLTVVTYEYCAEIWYLTNSQVWGLKMLTHLNIKIVQFCFKNSFDNLV